MACTAQKGQHPGRERGEQGNVLRMPPQQPFGKLHHYIQPPGGLKRGRTANDRKDRQHDIHRGLTGLEPKDKAENKKANAAYQPQPHSSKPGAY